MRRIAVMYAGEFVEMGKTEDIIFSPVHPYSQALMQSILVPEIGIKGKNFLIYRDHLLILRKPLRGCRFADRCFLVTEDCRKEDIEMMKLGEREVRGIRANYIMAQKEKVVPHV